MLTFVDNFLNKITMYRIVLYVLVGYFVVAVALSALGLLGYNPLLILASAVFIIAVTYIVNVVFAKVYNVSANIESVYITAFILLFLIPPPQAWTDTAYLSMAFWASVIAISSKYIIALRKKHLFNPAAFGVVVTFFALGQSATWWIGTSYMLPFTLIGGFLIVRKLRRSDLVFSFLLVALTTAVALRLSGSLSPVVVLQKTIGDTALIFFASVMLTEPLTMPPSTKLQMAYGALVGFLYAGINVGPVHFTPELALITGNIFAYFVSPKQRLVLTLKEKIKSARDTYDFIFIPDEKLRFAAGQYLEWTLGHSPSDTRGNRRYFTIASAPTENEVRLGAKFYTPPSSFKQALQALEPGMTLTASSLSGEFTLPKDTSNKLAFIAGGIGVTPFRSMAKYLLDTGEKRDIVMLYSNKTSDDIAYREIFDGAEVVGMKTVYVVNTAENADSRMRVGTIDKDMIMREIPDFSERTFYISGPHRMVTSFEKTLKEMGVPRRAIKVDYFPGFV